jgi:amidase
MSETLSRDILDATAGEIVEALADRQVGALELTEAAIDRIEARDPAINAVVVRDFDRARAAAKAADAALGRGERRPLLGLPMTVKESHNVAGLPSCWGSPAFCGFTAEADSVAVARLRAAGAVILGKTNIPPFLSDWQSANPVYGRTNNPWDPTRSAGGSSGGAAAAVAAGMVPLELGSDIGGSIRVPAAFCGIYGHKPSYDLIPQRGHAPPGLDGAGAPLAVVGPMARSAADLDLALDVLAGPAPEQGAYRLALPAPRHARLAEYRVLVLEGLPGVALDDEVAGALANLAGRLDEAGCEVARESELLPDLAQVREVYTAMLNTVMTRGAPGHPSPTTGHEWLTLIDRQTLLQRQWARLFEAFDVVLSPAFGTPAFPHIETVTPGKTTLEVNGRPTPYFDQLAWAGPATLGHLPATALPIGFSKAGLPIGAQAIGPYLEDRTSIGFAGLVEREFGGYRAPPL